MQSETPAQFFWLDLEMTGLNSQLDLITEVAVVITDVAGQVLAEYETGVAQAKVQLTNRLKKNDWFQQQSADYQHAIHALARDGRPLKQVEKDLLQLIDQYITTPHTFLAGNSIYVDRGFIEHYLPQLATKLHYRMLDVSAYKLYQQASGRAGFTKSETHRALADVYESINEFKFYCQQFSHGWLDV